MQPRPDEKRHSVVGLPSCTYHKSASVRIAPLVLNSVEADSVLASTRQEIGLYGNDRAGAE